MNREDFLSLIVENLDSEKNITENSVIAEIGEWDSLTALEVLSMFMKNFSFQPDIDELRKCVTLGMILDLANGKYE